MHGCVAPTQRAPRQRRLSLLLVPSWGNSTSTRRRAQRRCRSGCSTSSERRAPPRRRACSRVCCRVRIECRRDQHRRGRLCSGSGGAYLLGRRRARCKDPRGDGPRRAALRVARRRRIACRLDHVAAAGAREPAGRGAASGRCADGSSAHPRRSCPVGLGVGAASRPTPNGTQACEAGRSAGALGAPRPAWRSPHSCYALCGIGPLADATAGAGGPALCVCAATTLPICRLVALGWE